MPPDAEKRFSAVVPAMSGSRLAPPALTTTYGVAARRCAKRAVGTARTRKERRKSFLIETSNSAAGSCIYGARDLKENRGISSAAEDKPGAFCGQPYNHRRMKIATWNVNGIRARHEQFL